MRLSPRTGFLGVATTLAVLALTACDDPDSSTTGLAPDELSAAKQAGTLNPMETLGKDIFFDRGLSLRGNQACASCHDPKFGFAGPVAATNLTGAVYNGSVSTRFGNRKPPSAAYATVSPILYYDPGEDVWIGGNFWDGRATGELLGNPAADQALGPFLNPVEQALPDEICVIYRIATGNYADLWEEVWGDDLADLPYPAGLSRDCRGEDPIAYPAALRADVMAAYHRVGLTVAAYEGSAEVNAFTSKYDAVMAGLASFTAEEQWGRDLFEGKAMCSACHPSETPGALLTDFTYDNLGVPANPMNPVYEDDPGFVDQGLGAFLDLAGHDGTGLYGAVKVPTLRNVARSPGEAPKAFGHNGFFKSLEQIVHFYNTRDVLPRCQPDQLPTTVSALARIGFEPACWPGPEVAANVNVDELGDLGLTEAEEQAIVAFMRTLSDGWR
jgi:cytochrome c peroxidase